MQNKIDTWGMRADKTDLKQINTLARCLGVKEAEAVRRAVAYLLSKKEKEKSVKETKHAPAN